MHAKTSLIYLVNRLIQNDIIEMIAPYEGRVILENIFEYFSIRTYIFLHKDYNKISTNQRITRFWGSLFVLILSVYAMKSAHF